MVLEVRERPVASERLDPQCDAGEGDSGGVAIDTEEASFRDPSLAPRPRLGVLGPSLLVRGLPVVVPAESRCAPKKRRPHFAGLLDVRVMKLASEITHRLNQKVRTAACGIENSQALDLSDRLSLGQGPKAVKYEVPDERKRCVEGPRAFSRRSKDKVKVARLQAADEASRCPLLHRLDCLALLFVLRFASLSVFLGRPIFVFLDLDRGLWMKCFGYRARHDGELAFDLQVLLTTEPENLHRHQRKDPPLDIDLHRCFAGDSRLILEQPFVDRSQALDVELPERHPLTPDAPAGRGRRQVEQKADNGRVRKPRGLQNLPFGSLRIEEVATARRNVVPRRYLRQSLVVDTEEGEQPRPKSGSVLGPRSDR